MSPATATERLVEAIKTVVGPELRPANLHEPELTGREVEYTAQCIQDGWVSSVGPLIPEFEEKLAARCDSRAAIAVVNGTAALHLALHANGVGPGDEVLLPALTFVGTANAVSYCGATTHFVDCETESLGVDADRLEEHLARVARVENRSCRNRETGKRIAALIVVDVFGHPANLDALAALAERWQLPVVEDAAAALGSTYRGRPVGGHVGIAALSFNGNKIITTGGGGAVLLDDPERAEEIRHVATTAKRPHAWRFDHDRVGFNYRMPNLNAALGIAQLERLDDFIKRKRLLGDAYAAALVGVESVHFFREAAWARSNYWLHTMILEDGFPDSLDTVLGALHAVGIHARPAWTPLHRLPMYASSPRADLTRTETLTGRIVNLPSSPALANQLHGAS